MKETKGNIWDFYDQGYWVAIPTNGTVKENGEAVMGRGVALQAKQRFTDLPRVLGKSIQFCGSIVIVLGTPPFLNYRLVSFPVKRNWWEKADLKLIEDSCRSLATSWAEGMSVYMPRVGCGNGRLSWKDVKPILEKYLDDRFVVVEYGQE